MTIFLLIVFGLIIGSFLNMVIYRLHTRESMVWTRSHCVHCNHELAASDLIPVLSFLLLRGRCRYCHKPISWQYPVVEILTVVVFVLAGLKFSFVDAPLELAGVLLFSAFFIVVAVFDLKHYLILDKVIFAGAALAFMFNLVSDIVSSAGFFHGRILSGLLGALVISGFFLAQFLLSRGRWIGFGDVKFGIFLGLISGWPLCLVLLLLSYVLGAVTGIGLILAGKKQLSSKLPFGVFLGFSAIITMLFGQELWHWYTSLLGF
jgi:leader peptidase (prepilin peptidase) / N-methyltransferase